MGARRILPRNWLTPVIITTYLTWAEERGLADDTTIATYRGILNRLAYWLQDRWQLELLQAEHEHLRLWRSSLRHKPRSVRLYGVVMRGFYLWASREGYILRDPAWNVPLPRITVGKPRPIAEDPLEMAVERAEGRIRIWLVLAAYSGLRAMEIAGLEREDLYSETREDGSIRRYMIVRGKGGKERHVGISDYVWHELCVADLPMRGALFRRLTDGGRISGNRVSKVCNDYLRELGISSTLHKLRHRFATRGHRAVRDARVTQEILGHGSLVTAANYTESDPMRADEFVDAVQPRHWPSPRGDRD